MFHFQITRRRLIQTLGGVGIAAAIPLSRRWADAEGASLSFLAVGDWGRHGQDHQRDVAVRMGESAELLGARFVMAVGDNFYENGVTGVDDPTWKSSFEDVYTSPSLQVPWHVALGNHDYRGNTQAQIDYSAISHRWRLPARWYRFTERTPDQAQIDVFVVDTSPMIESYYANGARLVKVGDQKANVGVQLAWLDAGLQTSKADWKIVVGHHPIYWGGGRRHLSGLGADGRPRLVSGRLDLVERLDPILQRHRVPLYINGHIHDLQHVQLGATHYVCTGAGSKMDPVCDMGGSDFCSLHSGFIACAVNRARLRVAYRDYRGMELHVVDIARPA
ncbi:MAG TPA: tartrate-resistant acid phosphatase type 5 family protein [Steroidobacteraceae bacterium]|jgi:acid phosphatase|nr:tartrate-resistant acid phosphatase type 5 family protein [Steroidobacteraceae bacterium]